MTMEKAQNTDPKASMPTSAIGSFHQEARGDWFARLAYGHNPPIRQNPPGIDRPWVAHSFGRMVMLAQYLPCIKCGNKFLKDRLPRPKHNSQQGVPSI